MTARSSCWNSTLTAALVHTDVLRVPGGEAVLTTALTRRSADSVLVAAACGDGTVHLFGRTSGQAFVSSVLAGHRGRVLAAVFVRLGDGRTLLATGGEDGTVRLWHVDPRGLLPGRADEPTRVQAIATVPTERGDLLVAGGDNGSVQLHEAASGVPVGDGFTGHRGAVHAVAGARLPDGRSVLVTGGAERAVRVWDVATGSRLAGPLRGHQATIHAVAVLRSSPGEWLVASAGSDSAIRLWDPASGRAVGSPLRGHRGPIRCLAVAPSPAGSDTLISGGDDGTLRLWRLNGSGAAEFLRIDLPGSGHSRRRSHWHVSGAGRGGRWRRRRGTTPGRRYLAACPHTAGRDSSRDHRAGGGARRD